MKQNPMTKRVTTLSMLAGFSLLTACASDSDKAVATGGASNMSGAGSTGGATGSGGTSNMASAAPDAGSLAGLSLACPSADPSYICAPSGFAFFLA